MPATEGIPQKRWTIKWMKQRGVSPWEPGEGWNHPELGFSSENEPVGSAGQLLRLPGLACCSMPHLKQPKSVSLSLPSSLGRLTKWLCWAATSRHPSPSDAAYSYIRKPAASSFKPQMPS